MDGVMGIGTSHEGLRATGVKCVSSVRAAKACAVDVNFAPDLLTHSPERN